MAVWVWVEAQGLPGAPLEALEGWAAAAEEGID
jgi:hypothetical protein